MSSRSYRASVSNRDATRHFRCRTGSIATVEQAAVLEEAPEPLPQVNEMATRQEALASAIGAEVLRQTAAFALAAFL